MPVPPTDASEMRAVEYDRYGGPDELILRAVPRPVPGRGRVLVRVHATSVNPADVKVRSGAVKFMSGRRFPKRIGLDFTGTVAALGPGVAGVSVGERVWGFLVSATGRQGAAAEFVTADARAIGPAPVSVAPVSAAALPSVGLTALRALRETLAVRAGDRVLIVGASGGVGSTGIQLGVAMGARVTAVAGPANREFCRELGAEAFLDYTAPIGSEAEFDAVFDCHGGELASYRRLVRPGGRIATITTAGTPYALRTLVLPGPRVRLIVARSRRADLSVLAEYVDSGALRPIIEAVYPLERIAEAHRLVETGHARGKRVLTVAD